MLIHEILEENRGFDYEVALYNKLNKQGLVPSGFKPAGGGHSADGMFLYKQKPYNFEIKLDQAADYGQVELRNRDGNWVFGGTNEEAKELYTELGILDFVKSKWGKGGQPRKETVPTAEFTEDDMAYDYENFKDAYTSVPISALFDHYAKKNTYYIQVGKAGLYHMKKDIAGLGTPAFDAVLKLRIRIKRRTSKRLNGYGFLTALKIEKRATPSPLNLDGDISFLK